MLPSPANAKDPKKPLIYILTGPTGSGKSALAIRLAQVMGAEIIGADAFQVYDGLAIGTARTLPEEMGGISHHLIGFLSPLASFSAGAWCRLAEAKIDDIASRGHPIIVCGGTGLYLHFLLHYLGGETEESVEDAQRGEIPQDSASSKSPASPDGPAPLGRPSSPLFPPEDAASWYQVMVEEDPIQASRIHPNDHYRIQRYFLRRAARQGASKSQTDQEDFTPTPKYSYHGVFLDPPRPLLYDRLNRRCAQMFADGLLAETQALIADYPGIEAAQSFRAIGYHNAVQVLHCTMTEEAAIADFAQKTRRYAKRQLTWFRHHDDLQPLSLESLVDADQLDQVAAQIAALWEVEFP